MLMVLSIVAICKTQASGKIAGIVLKLEAMKDRKYWIRLSTTIEHFNVPIDIRSVDSAAYSKYK